MLKFFKKTVHPPKKQHSGFTDTELNEWQCHPTSVCRYWGLHEWHQILCAIYRLWQWLTQQCTQHKEKQGTTALETRIWNSLPGGIRTLDISYKHFKALLIEDICFDKATTLCDILYKHLKNILTYLLTYLQPTRAQETQDQTRPTVSHLLL